MDRKQSPIPVSMTPEAVHDEVDVGRHYLSARKVFVCG